MWVFVCVCVFFLCWRGAHSMCAHKCTSVYMCMNELVAYLIYNFGYYKTTYNRFTYYIDIMYYIISPK